MDEQFESMFNAGLIVVIGFIAGWISFNISKSIEIAGWFGLGSIIFLTILSYILLEIN